MADQDQAHLPQSLVAMGTAIHLPRVHRDLAGLPVGTLDDPRDHVLQTAEERVPGTR